MPHVRHRTALLLSWLLTAVFAGHPINVASTANV